MGGAHLSRGRVWSTAERGGQHCPRLPIGGLCSQSLPSEPASGARAPGGAARSCRGRSRAPVGAPPTRLRGGAPLQPRQEWPSPLGGRCSPASRPGGEGLLSCPSRGGEGAPRRGELIAEYSRNGTPLRARGRVSNRRPWAGCSRSPRPPPHPAEPRTTERGGLSGCAP